jgi:hypothetical protein
LHHFEEDLDDQETLIESLSILPGIRSFKLGKGKAFFTNFGEVSLEKIHERNDQIYKEYEEFCKAQNCIQTFSTDGSIEFALHNKKAKATTPVKVAQKKQLPLQEEFGTSSIESSSDQEIGPKKTKPVYIPLAESIGLSSTSSSTSSSKDHVPCLKMKESIGVSCSSMSEDFE